MDKFLESAKTNLTDQKFLFENLLFSIGPLTAIIAAKFGRRAWIKYEIVTTALLTLVLAFKPDFILSIVLNSPIKPFHHLLSAGYACYLVNIVLVPLFTLKSQDDSILYGHFYARILESSLIIIDNIVSYSEGSLHWNYKYLCFVTSMSLTYLAINIYFLSRTAKPSGQNPFKDLANSIGKIDFYIFLVSGIYVYAFPDRINLALAGSSVGVTNESFRSLTRSCGALILAMSLESFCMSEFKFIRDKKAFFLARLVASLLELAVFFSGFYCLRVYSLETFGCLASFSIVYQLFIFYGYYNTPQEHAKSH